MRLDGVAVTVEIRCARSGRIIKKGARKRATVELVVNDEDDCPMVTVQGKPPIAVRLEGNFQQHARFVHEGKLGFTSERGQRRSHIMLHCPGDIQGVANFAAVADRARACGAQQHGAVVDSTEGSCVLSRRYAAARIRAVAAP